ncbi:condensation domain-containing protein, partial [Bacillus altitudinis]|uniref:condensation domain-containing protein n=1 Tax=Bacillus altitudinis TaxID=293387 RepID=UPI00119EEC1E
RKQTSLHAFAHQTYPLEDLIPRLPLHPHTTPTPLFTLSFNIHNIHLPALNLPHLNISPYPIHHPSLKFHLSLQPFQRHREIKLTLHYPTPLFKHQTIPPFPTHLLPIIP